MYVRSRHRRGAYPLAREHSLPRSARMLIAIGALLFAGYLLWVLIVHLFGLQVSAEPAGAFLTTEDRGTVNVTIDGKSQRAENGMMLFPGESVSTTLGAHAGLQLFDGSRVRLNDGSAVTLTQSMRGARQSTITLNITQGNMWVLTAQSSTGSTAWTVTSPTLNYALVAGTEALLSPTAVTVYATNGEGITVTLANHPSFLISEGQQWTMPANGIIGSDIYAYRTPLDPLASSSQFVLDSRALAGRSSSGANASLTASAPGSSLLTVTAPLDGAQSNDPTVTVDGTVGPGVTQVTINGYPAVLDSDNGTFSQEVSPPEGEPTVDLTLQALDDAKNVLAEVRRTVKRAPPAPLGAPTITDPAQAGQTYQTQQTELILRGTAPANAAGIYVNDYKLQLFDPSKGVWSYVASLALGTMKPGANTYDITAVDATGARTPPAQLIIIQGGAGTEGVVSSTAGSSTSGVSSSSVSSSSSLPDNAPLLPGTLQVLLPEPGTTHTETGTGFLLEGTTSAKTASIWVNDYRLQLYRPGKTTWNYIVDAGIDNLKPGKNSYVVVARQADGQILDTVTYAVEYDPATSSAKSSSQSSR